MSVVINVCRLNSYITGCRLWGISHKKRGFNNQRQFIFHKGISLIDVISHEEFTNIIFDNKNIKAVLLFWRGLYYGLSHK